MQTERFKRVIRATQKWAFELLENAWVRLYDSKLATHWLDKLRPDLEQVPYFHYLEAVTSNAGGDVEAGRASLRKALELAPDFDRARDRLEEWLEV